MKGLTILLVGLLLFAGGAMFGTSHSTTESVPHNPSKQSAEACSPEVKEEESPLIVDVAVGMGESVGAGFDLVLMIMSDFVKA